MDTGFKTRFSSAVKVTAGVAASLALLFNASRGSTAWASDSATPRNQIQPKWSKKSASRQSPNNSFLSSTQVNTFNDPTLKEQIFDSKLSCDMKREYEDRTRNYEFRLQHDLVSHEEQAAHHTEMKDFTENVVRSYGDFHAQANLKKVQKAAENEPSLAQFKRPAAVAAMAAGAYTGRTMKVKLAENTKLLTRTDVPNSNASVAMEAPWLRSSVDYNAKPGEGSKADSSMANDRYRLSLSRGLPIWDLRSGISWSTTTSTTTASLSKQLHPNVTCVVDSSRSAKNEHRGQESLKVFYGINF